MQRIVVRTIFISIASVGLLIMLFSAVLYPDVEYSKGIAEKASHDGSSYFLMDQARVVGTVFTTQLPDWKKFGCVKEGQETFSIRVKFILRKYEIILYEIDFFGPTTINPMDIC